MTRKKQLWLWVSLSALTATAQYALIGALSFGANPQALPQWFHAAETALWVPRAIIESAVVVYLFQTQDNDRYRRIIRFFELVLFLLIIGTVGPAVRAAGLGQPMRDVGEPWYTLWSFGVGSYAPLMMASAAVAYKAQPNDAIAEQAQSETMESVTAAIRAQTDSKRERVERWLEHPMSKNGRPATEIQQALGVSDGTWRSAQK